ncbi:MAG: helix-turn-helix domain-containing protein [Clostridia bacterium]|nr:helix-turn-helix domain-containing protein [Clostridia bacterium]
MLCKGVKNMSMTGDGERPHIPVRVSQINDLKKGVYPHRAVAQNISLSDVVAKLTKAERERIISGYDIKNFARIFEDEDTMATIESFLENGMNISETSRKLYMHRNTLMYRLNKIRSVTGLDLRRFDMAVTFEILRSLYMLK